MATDGPILICGTRTLTAEGLAGLLREAGYDVLPVCESEGACFETVRNAKPGLVFLEGPVIQESFIRELVGKAITVAILVDTERADLLREAYMAGAKGSISTDISPQQLIQSVALLLQGATVLSVKPGRLMLEATRDAEESHLSEGLSGREQQLAILVAEGESNKEIAEHMLISVHTVKVHIGNILTKLDLRNRQQLAVYVAKEGMLEEIKIGR